MHESESYRFEIHCVCGVTLSTFQRNLKANIVFMDAKSLNHDKIEKPHVCDARCMSAAGHNCECQCGGKNHGIQSVR